MAKRGLWGGIATIIVVSNLWAGCTDEFVNCKETRTCKPPAVAAGEGGEGNAAGQGAAAASSVGSGETVGGAAIEGGANSVGASGAPTDYAAGTGGAEYTGGAGGAETSKFVGCDGEPFEGNEAILTSCILRVGCQLWWWPTDTISRCISDNTQKSRAYQRCSLDAKSWDDVALCSGERSATDLCAGKAEGKYCRGNELVYCTGAWPYARDCGNDSGACHDFGNESGSPGAVCVLPALGNCGETTTSFACGGSGDAYLYRCEDGTAWGMKCTQQDQECTGSACRDPHGCGVDGVACAGNVAQVCHEHAKWEFDCGSVGLRCETTGNNIGDDARHCLAPGCKREDVAACAESCDGPSLTVCYGGSPVTVDCRDYGFQKCSEFEFSCSDYACGDCVNGADIVSFATCE